MRPRQDNSGGIGVPSDDKVLLFPNSSAGYGENVIVFKEMELNITIEWYLKIASAAIQTNLSTQFEV